MTESIHYLSDWWRWWSNPLVNLHNSQEYLLLDAKTPLKELNFLQFLELRSILSLPDRPDSLLDEQTEIRSLALATKDELDAACMKAAVLSFPAEILQTNAQNWEKNYGVQSADEVRTIIKLWGQIPHKLKAWQESLILNLHSSEPRQFDLSERALLVIGAYLMSFFPDFFRRWSLTVPYEITLALRSTDVFSEDCKPTVDSWLQSAFADLHQNVLARYPNITGEIPDEQDEQEEQALSKLESLEGFNDA